MDNSYKDIADISVYVNFPLVEDPNVNIIGWTTTPWSLPGDIVLAVNAKAVYVKVKIEDKFYILAKDRMEAVLKDKQYEVVEEFSGSTLVGKKYTPPFDYYTKGEALLANPLSWTVVAADFVTTTDGTGIAHEAPAFGEDDSVLAKKLGIPFIVHVTPEGKFAPEVTDFAGMYIKPKSDEKDGHMKADIEIIKNLAAKGLLFKKEKIMHSYPHCYRCETPLFYYALPSWFINIQTPKPRLLETAKDMEWIPAHLKDGRFKNTMESAPDWNISRNRYWASPLPFWKSKNAKLMFVSSVADLKAKIKKSGNIYFMMRHGQAENNTVEFYSKSGHHRAPLTEKGVKEVEESAGAFDKKIDIIISSPYARAKETAERFCENKGLDKNSIIYDDRIKEWEVSSDFDGKLYTEMKQYYDGEYVNSPAKNFSDGESFVQLVKRVGDFIYDIESKYQNKTILIVGHGGEGRALNFVTDGYRYDDIAKLNPQLRNLKNAEIRELSFVPLPHNAQYELDLHRPYIDSVVLMDEEGEEYHRVPEVVDCWFESGSMPFAQDHYPFERPDWQKENFPAGFVAEYIAQTRTWFYYTHAVSTILFDAAPFKNVVTTGTLLAEDGQKMSKSKNNFPDPWVIFDKYGVDALRLYLMSSPLMKGEDANFSEKSVQDVASKIIGRLMNVLAFYELYRDLKIEKDAGHFKPENVLDIWILSRTSELVTLVTNGMNAYDMTESTRPFELFVDDLSTWYLRRSRDRVKDGDVDAKTTLYIVFRTVAKVLAPLAPFTAEEIWQKLKHGSDPESVHLAEWPLPHSMDEVVIEQMKQVREVVTLGLQSRQKEGIPVRQPLAKATIVSFPGVEKYVLVIEEELNVENVQIIKQQNENGDIQAIEGRIILDTVITADLKRKGDFRELIRAIQDLRKKEGLAPSDVITLTLPENTKEIVSGFEDNLKKTVTAKDVGFSGEEITIQKFS